MSTRRPLVSNRRPSRRGRIAPRPVPGGEVLESRLALASADKFAISGISNPGLLDYPPWAMTLADASTSKPVSATFSINGGPTFTRTGDQIESIQTYSSQLPSWGMRLTDDAGAAIYPSNAVWQVDMSATWSGESPVSKTIYFGSTDVTGPIVFPTVDWSASADLPVGVSVVAAAPYEQTASIVIDRTKVDATTWQLVLPAKTLVNNTLVASRYTVFAANTPTDGTAPSTDTVWRVVKAQATPDGTGITISIDPTNDKQDAGSVTLMVTDTGTPKQTRFIGIQVTDAQGRPPVKPGHVAIGAVNQNGPNDNAFFQGTLADDKTGIKLFDYQYIYLNGGPGIVPESVLMAASGTPAAGADQTLGIADTSRLVAGTGVTGPGVPDGTTVKAVVDGKNVVISARLTQSLNQQPLTFQNLSNPGGWRPFTGSYGYEGKKLIQSMREAWKGAAIPTVVYYNIMYPNESAEIALANIRNRNFIQYYFDDLKFTLDTIRRAANGSTVCLIMEPDFLAYMMRQTYSSASQADPSTILLGYDVVQLAKDRGLIAADSALGGGDGSTLVDFVQVINEAARHLSAKAGTTERVNLRLGWKFNLWANQAQSAPDGGSWDQGIAKVTDYFLKHSRAGEAPADAFKRGQAFIDTIALQTARWYFKAGITSAGMDFMALDKYGTDGGNPYNTDQTSPGFTDPSRARWLFNADHWSNYLRYAGGISKELARLAAVGSMPIHLWQIPVGHVNTSSTMDAPITNSQQKPVVGNSPTVAAYEDSAVTWIFGDTFSGKPPVDDTGKVLAVASAIGAARGGKPGTYQVSFSGGGGSGATGVPVVDPTSGALIGIQVTSGGSGYTSAPTVTVTGASSQSTFTALIRSTPADYWTQNMSGDPLITTTAEGLVSWGKHFKTMRDAGVEAILFGPGLPNATNGGGYADQLAQDGYFWAATAQAYLRNPQPLVDPSTGGAAILTATAASVTRKLGTRPVAMVQVTRSGSGLASAMTVPVTVVGGDATAGSDYSRADVQKTVVRFAPGQSQALVQIPLLATTRPQPREQLVLRLGAALSAGPAALVKLVLGTTIAPPKPAAPTPLAGWVGATLLARSAARRGAAAILAQPADRSGTDGGLRAAALILNAAGVGGPGKHDGASLTTTLVVAENGPPARGAPLVTLGRVFDGFSVRNRVIHGTTVTLAQFRQQLIASLASRRGFAIADYDLSATAQGRGGHTAAIAAYDGRSDRFLLVDPAGTVHRPEWVKSADLWAGTRTIDPRSGVSRGVILVST